MQKKVILIIISILILTLSILGITYAFMRPQVEEKEEKSNITINACAKIQLKDNGSVINLENTYPMDDEMGLETDPYEFTITSTCDNYIGFNLYLTSLTDNEIEDSNIHFAITSKENIVLVSNVLSEVTNGSKDFNTSELQELDLGIKGTHKNIYKAYSENLVLKGERNYKLYLWVDKDANNETMGKSFKVGLSAKSYSREKTIADVCLGKTAECITQNANLDSTLYFHNAELEGGAQDDSYRYAGLGNIVNNFICLDGGETTEGKCANDDADLYRIIGLFKNNQDKYEIKLIKYDYATSIQLGEEGTYRGLYCEIYGNTGRDYHGTKDNYNTLGGYRWTNISNNNVWITSELRKTNLNEYYLNTYLKTMKGIDIDNLITMHTWSLNGALNYSVTPKVMYDNEMDMVESSPRYPTEIKTVDDKIGLMYVSDYGYAAEPSSTSNWTRQLSSSNSSWIRMGLNEWTISRSSSSDTSIFKIADTSHVNTGGSDTFAVRPCFYLSSDVKIASGDGSKDNPYRLSLN